jgi:hypothetical protein
MNASDLSGVVRKVLSKLQSVDAVVGRMQAQHEILMAMLKGQARSITEEIDSIPGRRIFYTLSDRIPFGPDQDGLRGDPLTFLVSQDGPYIMTHYPFVIWKPSAPDDASNLGQWSPVCSWPLPTQQNPLQDRIDLSYEVVDGGSQRNFQNELVGPVFSRPDIFEPLPVPTLWSPNSVIQFFPTYENILFNPSAQPFVASTEGELYVGLLGYRCVNL